MTMASSSAATAVNVALTHKPLAANRTAWQEVEGEAVVIDLDTRKVLGLNATASLIWTRMDGNTTVASLVETVAKTFDVPTPQAQQDVLTFLQQMASRGLVELG